MNDLLDAGSLLTRMVGWVVDVVDDDTPKKVHTRTCPDFESTKDHTIGQKLHDWVGLRRALLILYGVI